MQNINNCSHCYLTSAYLDKYSTHTKPDSLSVVSQVLKFNAHLFQVFILMQVKIPYHHSCQTILFITTFSFKCQFTKRNSTFWWSNEAAKDRTEMWQYSCSCAVPLLMNQSNACADFVYNLRPCHFRDVEPLQLDDQMAWWSLHNNLPCAILGLSTFSTCLFPVSSSKIRTSYPKTYNPVSFCLNMWLNLQRYMFRAVIAIQTIFDGVFICWHVQG